MAQHSEPPPHGMSPHSAEPPTPELLATAPPAPPVLAPVPPVPPVAPVAPAPVLFDIVAAVEPPDDDPPAPLEPFVLSDLLPRKIIA